MWVLDMIIIKSISESQVQLNEAPVNSIQLQIHFKGHRNRNTASQESRIRHLFLVGLEFTAVCAAFIELYKRVFFFCPGICPLPDDRSSAKEGDSHRGAMSTLAWKPNVPHEPVSYDTDKVSKIRERYMLSYKSYYSQGIPQTMAFPLTFVVHKQNS